MLSYIFYHPSNMMLFVVGNIEPNETMELIRHNQSQKDFERENMVERAIVEEPYEIDQKEEVLQMDVVMPKLIVSMKINDILQDPKEKLKRELGMNVLLDLLFARSSSLYEKWTQEGLINDSFSASFTQERDYSFLQIGGDTTKPEQLKEKILDLIEDMKDYQICEEEFNRVKKENIGMLIGVLIVLKVLLICLVVIILKVL